MSTLTIQSARPRADRAQLTPVAASGSLRQRGTGQCRVSAFRARFVGPAAIGGAPEYVTPAATSTMLSLLFVQDRPIQLQQEETLITAGFQPTVVSGAVAAYAFATGPLVSPITLTDPSDANAPGLAGKPVSGPLAGANVLVTSKARTPQLTGWMVVSALLDLWCDTNAAVVDGESAEQNWTISAPAALMSYDQIILDYRLYTQTEWQSGYLSWTTPGAVPTRSQIVGISGSPFVLEVI